MVSYIGAPWQVIIDDATVTSAKLAADAVATAKIADDAVTGAKISFIDDSVAVTTTHLLVADGTDYNNVAMSGDATMANNGAVTIAAGAVETAMIADDAITGAKVALLDDSLAATTTHFLIADGTDYSSFALSGHATCTNAGVVSAAAAVISGQSELAATPAVTDMVLLYDASATALKKISALTMGLTWVEKATAYTAVTGDNVLVDCSAAVRTITLPASPVIGNIVRVCDATGSAATNNITVGRNSEKIQGASADLTIATNRASIGLVYYNTAQGWVLVEN